MSDDVRRELCKVGDVLQAVVTHLESRDVSNASLHMSATVRCAPLTNAAKIALETVQRLAESEW